MVPMIERLMVDCPVAMAVSLHAPNDVLRDELVPLNRKYPIAELLQSCREYLKAAPRDFITFEYCMLDGVNDTDEHAHQLIGLVKGKIPCKFNLIPLIHSLPQDCVVQMHHVQAFARILADAGIVTTVRKTRGDDIDAACGQLAGEVQDRTNAKDRMLRQPVAVPVTVHRPQRWFSSFALTRSNALPSLQEIVG